MPDIFGKHSLRDYEPYETYSKQPGVTAEDVAAQALAHAALLGAPPHNFDALGSEWEPGMRLGGAQLAVDTTFDPIGYLMPNYASVSSLIIENLRRSHRFEDMASMPAGVTVADRLRLIQKLEEVGSATYTDWAGTNSNTVTLGIDQDTYPYWPITVDVPYENSTVMAAARQGIALDSRLMEQGIKYCKDTAQRQFFFGNQAGERLGPAGKRGLFNQPITGSRSVIHDTAGATLVNTDPDDIFELFRSNIAKWSTQSNQSFTTEISAPAYLCLPPGQYQYLQSIKRSQTDMSVRRWLEAENPWTLADMGGPLIFKEMAELAGAGAGGTDRAVIHIKDPQMSEFIWMEPMPGPPLMEHFTTTIRLRAITGPFYMVRSESVIYIDGL